MIYDFSDIAPYVRSITYNKKNSFDDFGLMVENSTEDPADAPITKYVSVPFMDGYYDFTEIGGGVNYPNKQWSYTFIIVGDNDGELKERAAEVRSWLSVYSDGDLEDTDYKGWKYVKARYLGSGITISKQGDVVKLLMKVAFIAAPYMQTIAGQLVDATTFTPNLVATRYLYDMYATGSTGANGYLVRLITSVGRSFINENQITTQGYSAAVTITGTGKWWLAFPKTYNDAVYTVTGDSGCDVLDRNTYWVIRAKSNSISLTFEANTGHGPESGETCKNAILNATWYKSADYNSWLSANIPNTNHMRIVSEGEPTLQINGIAAEISSFALAVGDSLVVSNAKSTTCKLQYCTIQERR